MCACGVFENWNSHTPTTQVVFEIFVFNSRPKILLIDVLFTFM